MRWKQDEMKQDEMRRNETQKNKEKRVTHTRGQTKVQYSTSESDRPSLSP